MASAVTAAQLNFGFKVAQQLISWSDLQRLWSAADADGGWEDAWLYDHFQPVNAAPEGSCLEAWTLLAALATQTTRLRIGVLVTGNVYRHPAVLAHMLATVDHVSAGRVEFGFGAGWHAEECRRLGIPLPAPAERLARWDEACTVVHRLCTEDTVHFAGRYYQLEGAGLNPRPTTRPRFVLGASGPRALKVVARHADVWNVADGQVSTLRRGRDILAKHCVDAGRDPAEITLSAQLHVAAGDLLAARFWTARLVAAGARHVVFSLPPEASPALLRRLVSDVITPVRNEWHAKSRPDASEVAP
ncbi:LLM class flavin-dependent oxidoreductase [Micromonospora sp. NPDC049374]|uniref:LLM class flavin-dependent oxidoreductase n=1 Tax=Micromonospora sp. NPDC049374 TaxID=3154352 RepID=UPI003421FAA4